MSELLQRLLTQYKPSYQCYDNITKRRLYTKHFNRYNRFFTTPSDRYEDCVRLLCQHYVFGKLIRNGDILKKFNKELIDYREDLVSWMHMFFYNQNYVEGWLKKNKISYRNIQIHLQKTRVADTYWDTFKI